MMYSVLYSLPLVVYAVLFTSKAFLLILCQDSVRAERVGCSCTSRHKVSKLCLPSLFIIGPHPETLWYVHSGYGLLRLREQQGHPTPASCRCECFLSGPLHNLIFYSGEDRSIMYDCLKKKKKNHMYSFCVCVCACFNGGRCISFMLKFQE